MRYIIKYETKSKYFGFKKENYKEFEHLFQVFHFITNNQMIAWTLYEKQNVTFTELLRGDKNEINNC